MNRELGKSQGQGCGEESPLEGLPNPGCHEPGDRGPTASRQFTDLTHQLASHCLSPEVPPTGTDPNAQAGAPAAIFPCFAHRIRPGPRSRQVVLD